MGLTYILTRTLSHLVCLSWCNSSLPKWKYLDVIVIQVRDHHFLHNDFAASHLSLSPYYGFSFPFPPA